MKERRDSSAIGMEHSDNVSFHFSINLGSDDGFDTDNGSLNSLDEDGGKMKLETTEMNRIEHMSRQETNNLRVWRLVLIVVMLSTGALVSIGAFLYIRSQQHQESLNSYTLFTQTVEKACSKQFYDFWLSMSNMAATITAAGFNAEGDFPFVRVPMYEVSGSHARELSRVEYVTWNPIVTDSERPQWGEFVQSEKGWYDESKAFASTSSSIIQAKNGNSEPLEFESNSVMRDYVWRGNRSLGGASEKIQGGGPFAPIWQCSPPPFSATFLNYDLLSDTVIRDMQPTMRESRSGLFSAVNSSLIIPNTLLPEADHERKHAKLHIEESLDKSAQNSTLYKDYPHSVYVKPVYDGLDDTKSKMVGFLTSLVAWDIFLSNLLPDGVEGITAVLRNTCSQSYTYTLQGTQATFRGPGDLHQRAYSSTEFTFPLVIYESDEIALKPGHCVYSLSLFYSDDFKSAKENQLEIVSALVMAIIFAMMTAIFFMYDRFVHRRNAKIIGAAAQSNAIISSLFPTQVRDRLFAENANDLAPGTKLKNMMQTGNSLETELDDQDDDGDNDIFKSKPIADLFPQTTILFADIVGFTAWSSEREPSQVFILLETIFRAFDVIAKQRRIFKVETVGDCYVAAAGLPEPRKDHAVAMARFARDCMMRMRTLAKSLDVTLGPDTGDLAMRMGMHSGPVTAGVLRGDRSRFQLFGDTMNTAARMESNGERGRIHLSKESADLLIAAGKASWLKRREDVINAKGKGELQTYWLETSVIGRSKSVTDLMSVAEENSVNQIGMDHEDRVHDDKTMRLIDWNVDILQKILKQIVARRRSCRIRSGEKTLPVESFFLENSGCSPMDEVTDIITLPKFHEERHREDADDVVLKPIVIQQLHSYVSNIASLYHRNPFHNFEHASHVSMSVAKLLSRIVAPAELDTSKCENGIETAATLHDHTYGITSDPLTQFSCVLSAMIHDAGHHGVPNAQLVLEETADAKKYNNKSVAEQNSVDMAWSLMMRDEYDALRSTIYRTHGELERFRQILVNAVMATDIVDKDLKQLRNMRWDRAFSSLVIEEDESCTVNRKATIVIEHLIQASDVSHTMQHWHIYRKWNERFFMECYQAYVDGRAEKNPADGWYEGEIGFFDFYIIPLAKKLKDCGVFGVSSDEYLNYAMCNRQEWEKRGREVVSDMIEEVQKTIKAKSSINSSRCFI